jgi:hypothetical protein
MRRAASLGPVMLAASLVVPEQGGWRLGVPDALGCTGGGPGTGGAGAPPEPMWQRLAPAGEPGAVTPVATDGFLPLRGIYTGLSVEEALASINLVVTDETGNKVLGSIKAFGESHQQQVFGWTATQALAIGQRLTAFISVTSTFDPRSTLTQTYALEVVGPPEALPEPSAVFYGWSDAYKGVGPLVSCNAPLSSCGPSVYQVSSAYEATGHLVELFSKVAPKSGVAWEVSLAAPFGSPESASYSSYPVLVTSSYEGAQIFGEIVFGLTANEVCAIVVAKDLRTGTEARGEVCGAPEPATRIKTDGLPLSYCDEPPSAAARDLWCEARKKDSRPCEPTAENPSEPTVPGPVASDPMNADADAEASDRAAATSKGCQQGGPGSTASWGAWALSLAALSGGAARRRRYWA